MGILKYLITYLAKYIDNMTLEEYKDLVDLTITDKTANYSITPQNVGERLKDLADIVPTLSTLLLPVGTIIMYAPATLSEFNSSGLGVSSNVIGWAICNGNNLTPNLTGRFVVGYNPSDADYNAIGNIGGQKSVTQVLEHSHFVVKSSQVGGSAPGVDATNTVAVSVADGDASQNYDMKAVAGQVADIGLTSKTGSTAPDNRPPYYTVLYIKKIS